MIGTEILFGPLMLSCLIVIATSIFLYWYAKRNHGYWKERGIPYVKPTLFFGSILETLRTPPSDLELKWYSKFGPVYGYFEANRPVLAVGDPKILRTVLVKDFSFFSTRREFYTGDEVFDSILTAAKGEQWKRIRTIVAPTFTSGKLKRMIGIFKECSNTLLQNLKMAAVKSNRVDAKRMFGAFSMDVIASSAFSTKIDSHNDPDNIFVKTAKIVFQKRRGWRLILHLLFPDLMTFLGIAVRPPYMRFFKDVTLQIIEERKRTGQTRNDFLQLLLDTAKETEENEREKILSEKESGDIASNYTDEDGGYQVPKYTNFKKDLTMNELVAQCVIFFLAGYETVSNSLSSAIYCLALNEDVQQNLRDEVDKVLRENNGELTYETLQGMKYLDNFISETLRMYPPIPRIERVADADYESKDLGFTIPKGMVIDVPIYAIHRDPRNFPDPEKFDPERFNSEEKATRDHFVYIPFLTGPRNCVAMRFALLQVKICLVHVISAFKIKRCPQTQVPLEFNLDRSLLKAKEIIVGLEPREGSRPIR